MRRRRAALERSQGAAPAWTNPFVDPNGVCAVALLKSFGDIWGNFPHIPVSVLYELATPSTSEAVLEQ